MSKVMTAETVVPVDLSLGERKQLGNLLYQVHKRIFGGLSEEDFNHYVVDSPAATTKIFLYRAKRGKELAGYFAVHRFEKDSAAGTVAVFRAEAGLVPEYTRRNANLSFFLREVLKYKFRHPSRRVYFLAAPVNPSTYAILARYIRKLHPKHDAAMPMTVKKFMLSLATQFGLESIEGESSLVRKIGWKTEASHAEKEFWRKTRNPHVRFYVHSNPHFAQGNGLLTLVPCDFHNLLASAITFFFYTVKKRIRNNLRLLLRQRLGS